MRIIDIHDGRIPTECPGCGAEKTLLATAGACNEAGCVPNEGDDMAVDISFACGAKVRWRSAGCSGPEGGGHFESLVELVTCPPGLSAILVKAREAHPELRLGQLVWSAAWLAWERRSGSAPPDDPNLVFYIDDEALAYLDSITRGSSLPGDEATRTAGRIGSYLTRKAGASLDGEMVDHIARLIRESR